MKTYYMVIDVFPIRKNEHFELIKSAQANCWIIENDPHSAFAKASFHISRDDFKIIKIDMLPVVVTKEDFLDRDIGLEQYIKAQDNGIAIFYVACARDRKISQSFITIKPSYKFNYGGFLQKHKQLKNSGRCLHYDGNSTCKEIINAHSIQKNQMLSMIAENGHVYMLSVNKDSSNNYKPMLSYKKFGINKSSTFLGFCKKHDNELFQDIDNFFLRPTHKQVFLYAYRSLCREFFVKSNSLNLLDNQIQATYDNEAIRNLFTDMKLGTSHGFEDLKKHKSMYDALLQEKSYNDIKYVLFISKQKPNLALSGLFYPDFDFMGNYLQDLGDTSIELQLIAVCSAPLETGWGLLFAWHKSSSNVCVDFMRSLATVVHDGKKLNDLLFRFAINFENLAISPRWWEPLSTFHKEQIISYTSLTADVLSLTQPSYLTEGLEGIIDWEFYKVISHMD